MHPSIQPTIDLKGPHFSTQAWIIGVEDNRFNVSIDNIDFFDYDGSQEHALKVQTPAGIISSLQRVNMTSRLVQSIHVDKTAGGVDEYFVPVGSEKSILLSLLGKRHYSGEMKLVVNATTKELGTGAVAFNASVIDVLLRPVAQAPMLSLEDSSIVVDEDKATIKVNFTALSLNDTDGSEALLLAVVVNGSHAAPFSELSYRGKIVEAVSASSRLTAEYRIPPGPHGYNKTDPLIFIPKAHLSGVVEITVVATSVDSLNFLDKTSRFYADYHRYNHTTETSKGLTVEIWPVVDTPSLHYNQSLTAYEDTKFKLPFRVVDLIDKDGSEYFYATLRSSEILSNITVSGLDISGHYSNTSTSGVYEYQIPADHTAYPALATIAVPDEKLKFRNSHVAFDIGIQAPAHFSGYLECSLVIHVVDVDSSILRRHRRRYPDNSTFVAPILVHIRAVTDAPALVVARYVHITCLSRLSRRL